MTPQPNTRLLGIAFLAGIIFDVMFWDKPIGLSLPAYALSALVLLWSGLGHDRLSSRIEGWVLVLPIILLAITFGYHSNPVLLTINFLIIPPLFIVHAMMVSRFDPVAWWRSSIILELLEITFYRVFSHFDKPFKAVASLLSASGDDASRQTLKRVVLGLVLALPLMLVIIPLLTSADLIFSGLVEDTLAVFNLERLDQFIGRSIIVTIVLLGFFGLLWTMRYDKAREADDPKAGNRSWDPTTSITVLVVTNLVYLAFTVVQFKYLYVGAAGFLPEEFTYSEYARRGFWELLAVSAINLSLLLAFMAKVQRTTEAAALGMKISLIALVLFAANLLFAAHTKMSLYEAVYGLTYLRFFAHYFMALLLVLFALPLVHLIIGKVPLVKSYIVVALSFYVVLNFIGVDKIIATHNLQRYEQWEAIDIAYLSSLSDDAIPVLAKTQVEMSPADRRMLMEYLSNRKADLSKKRPWQSATISRSNALNALDLDVY